MAYEVRFSKRAERFVRRLPDRDFNRVTKAIRVLEEDPRPRGTKKLRTTAPQWRLRVGPYRIVYTVLDDDRIVTIESVLRRTTRTYKDI